MNLKQIRQKLPYRLLEYQSSSDGITKGGDEVVYATSPMRGAIKWVRQLQCPTCHMIKIESPTAINTYVVSIVRRPVEINHHADNEASNKIVLFTRDYDTRLVRLLSVKTK